MLEISKNEFLSKIDHDIRHEEITDIRAALEQVWAQAADQAVSDHERAGLRHDLGAAVMAHGGPEEVGKIIGVSADTVKRWVVNPFDLRLSELRRLQMATGLSLKFEVYPKLDSDD